MIPDPTVQYSRFDGVGDGSQRPRLNDLAPGYRRSAQAGTMEPPSREGREDTAKFFLFIAGLR